MKKSDYQRQIVDLKYELAISRCEIRLLEEAATTPASNSVAAEAERIITGARRDAYGPVRESFERIATMWSAVVGRPLTVEEVAAMMVCLKVCRELGGKHHRDNLVDVVGYTLLWDRMVEEGESDMDAAVDEALASEIEELRDGR